MAARSESPDPRRVRLQSPKPTDMLWMGARRSCVAETAERRSPQRTRLDHRIAATGRRRGSPGVRATFPPRIRSKLKVLARSKLRMERPGHTLNTNALVHEAYFKLVGQTRVAWQNRGQFFGVASEAMRRILIDYAKLRRAAGNRYAVPALRSAVRPIGGNPLSRSSATQERGAV